ncbi:MAG: peptidase T [Candidatus Izemoplasmatales bacterium]|nr:peptidase T [Candidatus Izemoplasmatales bacterium]
MSVLNRFLNYVKYDTQSKSDVEDYPSTSKQLVLLNDLLEELKSFGLEANIDNYGYVIARIKGNINKKAKTVALIAHVDTSPDASGKDVKAKIIEKYDGKEILLNEEKGISLNPNIFPNLKSKIGDSLVVTDGTTLLGADDKLGVAEIMDFVEYTVNNPDYKHGDIVIVFTPDEEVGNGTQFLDIKSIDADFGYTLDGSQVGEIAYENFNAATAKITVYGKSVHPGSAKNKMLNAIDVAYEFNQMLPKFMRAEITENYEGFNHLLHINGSVEKCEMTYIIRNHDKQIFEKQKIDFNENSTYLNKKYGKNTVKVDIEDSYFNMKDILDDHQEVIDIAIASIKEKGITPIIEPIRGGTDGARLTFMGLPCPNLGTGGYNFHGPYEYASITEMNLAVEIIKTIVSKVTEI